MAAAYVIEHPRDVQKLVLINPVAEATLQTRKGLGAIFIKVHYWLGKNLPEKLARKFLSAKLFVIGMSITMAKTHDRKLRKYIHNQHLTYFGRFHSPKSLSEAFITSATRSVGEFAGNIKLPTLLIAGDKDYLTTVAKQQELARTFDDATLIVIKNVGHLTHYETPDQIADAIKKFI